MKTSHAGHSTKRPHWLCIAYAFPPINRSGTHRTLAFVKHLDEAGWDATVLTVEPRDEPLDMSLVGEVPASTTVLRTPWVDPIEWLKKVRHLGRGADAKWRPARFEPPSPSVDPRELKPAPWKNIRELVSRLMITPDSRVGWIVPAVAAGMRAIRRRRPDVIYSTSPYTTAHLIALTLSRWTHIPWVADFRDPWRGNAFRDLGFPSVERWDSLLEWVVLRSAAWVVCNTPAMTKQLQRRRPFTADKCTTILNGFDRERFDTIRPTRIAPVEDFVLTHCGQFYGPRSPRVWFEALRRTLGRRPEFKGRIHIVLIGPEHFEGRHLMKWASDAGVGDCVRVLGQKGHAETLSYMVGSDALMLAGSTGPGSELQIPNKLFEYLAVRKPILATFSPNSPVIGVLRDARAEALVCRPDDDEALAQAITRMAIRRHPRPMDAWSGVSRFDRTHRAGELLEVFRRVARGVAEGYCEAKVTRPVTKTRHNLLPPPRLRPVGARSSG